MKLVAFTESARPDACLPRFTGERSREIDSRIKRAKRWNEETTRAGSFQIFHDHGLTVNNVYFDAAGIRVAWLAGVDPGVARHGFLDH